MALNNMGYIAMTVHGDLEQAEALFERALALNAHNKMSRANRGEINRRRQKYDAALDELRRAIEIDPRYVNAHNETAMVYVAMARATLAGGLQPEAAASLNAAGEWHRRALALVPAQERRYRAELHRRLGRAYQEHGFDHEAAREATEAQDLDRSLQEHASPG